MTLDQFLALLATILGAVGTVYVLKSMLGLTPKLTERLSASRYGHNPEMIDSLSSQKADGIVGSSLVGLALLVAIANSAVAPAGVMVEKNRLSAIGLAFGLAILVCGPVLAAARVINLRNRRATARIVIALMLDSIFRHNEVPSYEMVGLHFIADRYLNLKSVVGEASLEWLRRLAEDVGRQLPDSVQIEGEPQK